MVGTRVQSNCLGAVWSQAPLVPCHGSRTVLSGLLRQRLLLILASAVFDQVPLLLPFPRDPDEPHKSETHEPFTGHALTQGEASRWLHLPPLPFKNAKLL